MQETSDRFLLMLGQISWRAAVATAVVLAVRTVAGRRIPGRWQHALWVLVLCRLLMPVAPPSRMSVFNLWRPARAIVAPTIAAATAVDGSAVTVKVEPVSHAMIAPTPATIASRSQGSTVLAGAWLAVAAVLVARLVVANVRFQRRLASSGRSASPALMAAFEAGLREMGVRRRPGLVLTDAIATPAVCGVLRPHVLIPTDIADALTPERARLVFLHELAHIRCHDLLIDWVWALVRCAHWFNPVVWLVQPFRRHDREVARDEMVLAVVGEAGADAYGRTLLDLARPGSRPAMAVGLVGLFDGCGLGDRVRRVARHQRRGSTWVGAALLAAAGCASLTNPPATAPTTSVADRPATSASLDVLQRHIPHVHFAGDRLVDAVDFFGNATGADIDVDWTSLATAGIHPETRVTTPELHDVAFAAALRAVFDGLGGSAASQPLEYRVNDDGIVTITVRGQSDRTTVTRRYDVSDLLFVADDVIRKSNDGWYTNADDGPANQKRRDDDRTRRLADLRADIGQNVEPTTWTDRGGKVGAIANGRTPATLLIRQTPESQRKIQALLDARIASRPRVSLASKLILVDPGHDAVRELFAPRGATRPSGPDHYEGCVRLQDGSNRFAQALAASSAQVIRSTTDVLPSGRRTVTNLPGGTLPLASWTMAVTAIAMPDQPLIDLAVQAVKEPAHAPTTRPTMIDVTQCTTIVDDNTTLLFRLGSQQPDGKRLYVLLAMRIVGGA